MFFGVFFLFSQKQPMCFSGFSRFLVLENLKRPKKQCFFVVDFSDVY